ncbi:MAG: RHS repeat-associated core domain-containing protein [Chloroflexota bacterium]|nr:hypothetical protein [Chloroflexota bacterium]MBI5703743.1 hypothetical protein [Chloroflexota bacterium]
MLLDSEVRYAWTASLSTSPAYELTKYTYTGQYSHMDDPATAGVTEGFGLMFYNARWLRSVPVTKWRGYDPSLGRFAQADTIVPGGVQGLDKYAYVNNTPTRFTDPSGHREVEWTEGGGGFPLGGSSDDGLNLGGGNSFTVTNMAITPMLLNGELSYLQITRGWFSNWLSKYALQSVHDVNIVCSGGYCTYGIPPSMENAVFTPDRGLIFQDYSEEALIARNLTRQGHPLYKIGTLGVSRTIESQHWSLVHPYIPGYISEHGIPPLNVQSMNFVIVGRIDTPNTIVITESSVGYGTNPGGAIEIVVDPFQVKLQLFLMPSTMPAP